MKCSSSMNGLFFLVVVGTNSAIWRSSGERVELPFVNVNNFRILFTVLTYARCYILR